MHLPRQVFQLVSESSLSLLLSLLFIEDTDPLVKKLPTVYWTQTLNTVNISVKFQTIRLHFTLVLMDPDANPLNPQGFNSLETDPQKFADPQNRIQLFKI